MEQKRWNQGILQLFLLFFLLLPLDSQASSGKEGTENYFEVLYNNYSGLLTSEANDIVQTADGSIWIASYSSLVRYDGKNFVSFADSSGLTSILCLFVDDQDRLWVGTNNDGVVLYENNSFTFMTENQDVPSFSTRSMSQLSDGRILVGTALGLYVISEDMTINIIDDIRLQDSFILQLESFGENQTFGLTKTGDIFILDGLEIVDFIPVAQWDYDLPLSVLPLEDQEGEYFIIGTNSDYLLKMRLDKGGEYQYQVIDTESLKYINALYLDSKDKIWIGSDSGIGYLGDNEELFLLDYLSNGESIENIWEDMEGNYWFASSKRGVLKLNSSMFKDISTNLSNVVQFNGVALLDGYIYVASTNGIDIIQQSDLSVVENALTQRYRGAYVRCVQKDEDGNLWFSTYTDDAVVKYNPKTEEITTINEKNGINYSRIRSTMTASDGKIWVASGNGVYVVEDEEVIAYFGSEEGFQSLEILTLSEDLDGRVFAGTDGAGVYVIENMEITKRLNREAGLHSDIVLRTETDPFNGGTWIVTGNSIAFYDPYTDNIKIIDNFPYKNNFDLLFYEDNMIILSSNGVFFVNHETMLSGEEIHYLQKNHLNGLYSSLVANSFSTVEDGVLYLCGYQSLTAFNMVVDNTTSSFIPPIDLPSLNVNGALLYPVDGCFHLPSNANFIELNIFIPTYALEDYNVSYSLLGYDEFMHTADYDDYVNPSYTNLRGGNYEFLIQLKDNRTDTIINESTFIIKKDFHFWEHPLVQLLSFLLIMVSIILFARYIYRNREKKNQEKQDELSKMYHETVEVLSHVIDAKDCYTNGHSKRVAFYTKAIAKAMNFSDDEVDSAYVAGLLHDVGKISIPDSVLNKPGRLDKEEFEIMKTHAQRGADILKNIRARPELTLGAKYHHERYDGKGYGHGLAGQEIPLLARIIGVADAFDAMYSSRVYRKKLELEYVLNELETNSGTQFDPDIVKIMVRLIKSGAIDAELNQFVKEDEEA